MIRSMQNIVAIAEQKNIVWAHHSHTLALRVLGSSLVQSTHTVYAIYATTNYQLPTLSFMYA